MFEKGHRHYVEDAASPKPVFDATGVCALALTVGQFAKLMLCSSQRETKTNLLE